MAPGLPPDLHPPHPQQVSDGRGHGDAAQCQDQASDGEPAEAEEDVWRQSESSQEPAGFTVSQPGENNQLQVVETRLITENYRNYVIFTYF